MTSPESAPLIELHGVTKTYAFARRTVVIKDGLIESDLVRT